ncbi:MAG: hypothetical protein K6360_04800 [Deltaproteobacteria bacterium]
MKTAIRILPLITVLLAQAPVLAADGNGFTKEDRELLRHLAIRTERHDATLSEFKDSVDKRFEQVDKRLSDFKDSVDKRFEQVDQRFEQVDKRLEFMQDLMIAMLAVFGSLCGVFVGLLLWDRKTFMERAKESAMRELETKWRINDWLRALRTYSEKKPDFAEILRRHNLL